MRRAGLIDILYWLRRWTRRVLRLRSRGVKVLLFNARGEVALIRNTYGNRDQFVLPGGGIRWRESAADAAAREVREELGLEVANLQLRSLHSSRVDGGRDEIALFEGRASGRLSVDRFEVREARFVLPHDPPGETSPATRRRIDEYLGRREPDGTW